MSYQEKQLIFKRKVHTIDPKAIVKNLDMFSVHVAPWSRCTMTTVWSLSMFWSIFFYKYYATLMRTLCKEYVTLKFIWNRYHTKQLTANTLKFTQDCMVQNDCTRCWVLVSSAYTGVLFPCTKFLTLKHCHADFTAGVFLVFLGLQLESYAQQGVITVSMLCQIGHVMILYVMTCNHFYKYPREC